MRRAELLILLACPTLLAGSCLLLPIRSTGGTEGGGNDPILVEAVGVRAEKPADGRPLVLGYGQTADLRLPGLNGPVQAAVLYPPGAAGPVWRIVSATPQLAVWLRDRSASPDSAVASFAPWKGRTPAALVVEGDGVSLRVEPTRLHEVVVRGADGTRESSTVDLASARAIVLHGSGAVILSCPTGGSPHFLAFRDTSTVPPGNVPTLCTRLPEGGDARWHPLPRCTLRQRVDCHHPSAEAAALVSGGPLPRPRVVRAWAEPVGAGPLWISLAGEVSDSLRLTFRPTAILDGKCTNGRGCTPAPLDVRFAAAGARLGTLGPVPLQSGSLLAVGGRTLFVKGGTGPASPLDLLYVRKPGAPSLLRASSGADLYHPSARGIWHVPRCARDSVRLRLIVGGSGEGAAAAAGPDPATLDRRLGQALEEAGAGTGASSGLGGAVDGAAERIFALCHGAQGGREVLHVVAGQAAAPGSAGAAPPLHASLGTADAPREELVPIGSVLLRAARATDVPAQRRTRTGLVGFLIAVLLLQAMPLHRARRRRAESLRALRDDPEWRPDIVPEEPGAATVLQLASAVICALLFVGASYQMALAADPRLAGAPDYVQSFIDAVMLVGIILVGAAWSALRGGTVGERVGDACLGAGLAALAALAWWVWDGAGLATGMELMRERSAASLAVAGRSARTFALAGTLVLVPLILPRLGRLRDAARRVWLARRPRRRLGPWPGVVLCLGAGVSVAVAQKSALGFELGVTAALAWYTAMQWDFVIGDGSVRAPEASPESPLANVVGGVLILSVFLFLFMGAKLLPTFVSVALGLAGLLGFLVTWWQIQKSQFDSLKALLRVWFLATCLGGAVCGLLMRDLGSLAAWLPALVCGFLLWTVRPEEPRNTPEEVRRTWLYLALAVSAGLFLLGVLDIGSAAIAEITGDHMTRERQRVVLAQDVSYLSAGEWITQVRWLAAGRDGAPTWVPNLNSDVALFGVGAVFGGPAAWLASLGVIAIAAGLAWTCDQALRQGWIAEQGATGGARLPALSRAAGLFLGMTAILLLAQWLVHLTTGVDLRYPITGLVFPWISHGKTSHLLFTAAVALPLAFVAALEDAALQSSERGA